MSVFKKKRDEEYFYDYLSKLTPVEIFALIKAFMRFMDDINQAKFFNKEELLKDNSYRKEIS